MEDKNQRWNAEDYHNNSSVQLESSLELLKQVDFREIKKILDIGCGDGKITALISSKIPNGSVLGIDLSPEMINFSKNTYQDKYENLNFDVKKAEEIDYHEEFDAIFSSYALHWVVEFNNFIFKAHNSLRKNGKIIFTIPLGISKPLENASEEAIKSSKWSKYFNNYIEPWQFSSPESYKLMLEDAGFIIEKLEVINHVKIFNNKADFIAYVVQWYPYITQIEEHKKEKFYSELFARCFELQKKLDDGKIHFEFPRIDIIAKKI